MGAEPDVPDETYEVVLIGGGNMGGALAAGWLRSGRLAASALAVVELDPQRRSELTSQLTGVSVLADVPRCSGAVIAVKPPDVHDAVTAAVDAGATRVLSIAAGVRLATLDAAAGEGVAVVRAMPNTPALVGAGVAAIAGGVATGDDDLAWAGSLLEAVGTVEPVPESYLDAFTGLAGSGPAYVFLVAEALVDAAVREGLPRDLAERVVTQLLVGSAALLAERGDAVRLRAQVTSPGGTTAAGVHELEERGLRTALAAAVRAATQRSRELG